MENNLKISSEIYQKELAIQIQVNQYINEFKSFYFDAGAGAGKTYSLIKTIEHILENNSDSLIDTHQKILCITYTNAAKNEIINRIGYNSSVVVTTIHEFLWSFIGRQQPLLIHQHKIKIEEKLSEIANELPNYKIYREVCAKASFEELVLDEVFIADFYRNYDKKADEFRETMRGYIEQTVLDVEVTLKNVENFKKVVSLVNKQEKLQDAFEEIKAEAKIKIEYIPTRNKDNLSKFFISHNTLLEYAKEIIKNNKILTRLFYDKYPYVLVDEYQDTDEKVIAILDSVFTLSQQRNTQFVIGYFGDYMQNIYETRVGKIQSRSQIVAENFKPIKKKFNRRSTAQIVNLIEKIRNDSFGQISIYEKFNCGSHRFRRYPSSEFDLSSYIDEHLSNGGACLLMKNQDIARERQFNELYNSISQFPRFNGANYNNITSEFLTSNLQNMGWFLREVFNLVDFIVKVKNFKSTVRMITNFWESSLKMTYGRLKDIIEYMENNQAITLEGYIKILVKSDISNHQSFNNDLELDEIIKNIFMIEDISANYLDQVRSRAYRYFINNDDTTDEELEVDKRLIDSFFQVNIEQFINWYKYVKDDGKGKGINYFTLHGSKGLEFDDVVVVLDNNFASRKDYIQFFFENYNETGLSGEYLERFNAVRNLLYVACSRAKKNLHVIYLADELGEVEEENIRTIFGEGEIVL